MDKSQIIKWSVPVIARGIAWFLAGKLGMEAAEANSLATAAAAAIGALLLISVSVYTSIQGRKKLLAQEPPKK